MTDPLMTHSSRGEGGEMTSQDHAPAIRSALELAAPDLLEALKAAADLLPHLDGMDRSRRLLGDRARAAIAKATGQ